MIPVVSGALSGAFSSVGSLFSGPQGPAKQSLYLQATGQPTPQPVGDNTPEWAAGEIASFCGNAGLPDAAQWQATYKLVWQNTRGNLALSTVLQADPATMAKCAAVGLPTPLGPGGPIGSSQTVINAKPGPQATTFVDQLSGFFAKLTQPSSKVIGQEAGLAAGAKVQTSLVTVGLLLAGGIVLAAWVIANAHGRR